MPYACSAAYFMLVLVSLCHRGDSLKVLVDCLGISMQANCSFFRFGNRPILHNRYSAKELCNNGFRKVCAHIVLDWLCWEQPSYGFDLIEICESLMSAPKSLEAFLLVAGITASDKAEKIQRKPVCSVCSAAWRQYHLSSIHSSQQANEV